MVPKIMHANNPVCQRKRRVQKGSSPAGPLGKLARLAFMEAKKAWVRPLPSVSGMPAGIDEGTTHPTIARIRMVKSSLNSTPSEISKPMRGVLVAGVDARSTAR